MEKNQRGNSLVEESSLFNPNSNLNSFHVKVTFHPFSFDNEDFWKIPDN